MMADFRSELASLLNRYNKEQNSDTPDFILAGYIESCLLAYESAVVARDQLAGRKLKKHCKVYVSAGSAGLLEVAQ